MLNAFNLWLYIDAFSFICLNASYIIFYIVHVVLYVIGQSLHHSCWTSGPFDLFDLRILPFYHSSILCFMVTNKVIEVFICFTILIMISMSGNLTIVFTSSCCTCSSSTYLYNASNCRFGSPSFHPVIRQTRTIPTTC